MKRYLHNKSHYHLVSASMGNLVPIGAIECLAGDTVDIQNMGLIRFSPLVTPVMHPINVVIENYFVPNRILDPKDGSFSWEDFITGGEDGQYTTPPPSATATIGKGSIMEHFGVPPGSRTYNTFIAKCYAAIWNEYYRDQQLQAEIDLDSFDGSVDPLRVAWERDYFTSARPEPQLGDDTLLPLGDSAPVMMTPGQISPIIRAAVNDDTIADQDLEVNATSNLAGSLAGSAKLDPNGTLYADLASATQVSINDLREGFAIQRYKEARNLYGARFTEYLRYLGIQSSDARLQRPEMISRGRATVNFSEVLRTGNDPGGPAGDGPIGEMAGHGIAGVRTRRGRYFCEEHGHVISVMYARPRTIYTNALHRKFSRATKEDYWQRELQAIGQEEVKVQEVYADAADPQATFGYTPRYESFKRNPSYVSGDFRDTLDSWHLARNFGSEPALNASFIECDPADRIFADTDPDTDKLWCTFRNKIAVRSMLRKGIGSTVR